MTATNEMYAFQPGEINSATPPSSPTPTSTPILSPTISILSPQNNTFFNVSIEGVSYQLIYETNTTLSWVGYSINGIGNSTVSENATWVHDFGSSGYHTLTLYANDTSGNWAIPQTVTYLVNLYPDYAPTPSPSPTEQPTLTPTPPPVLKPFPFPEVVTVILLVAAIVIGAYYFGRHKKRNA